MLTESINGIYPKFKMAAKRPYTSYKKSTYSLLGLELYVIPHFLIDFGSKNPFLEFI